MMQNGASITVYDFTTATGPGVVCTMIMKTFTHTATLKFEQPGEILLRVWGRAIASDTPPDGTPVVVEKKIKIEKIEKDERGPESPRSIMRTRSPRPNAGQMPALRNSFRFLFG